MEDIYASILRMVFGIVTLVGLLWGAVRYLVKYKIFRCSQELKEYSDKKIEELKDEIHYDEGEVYDLTIRMTSAERRIGALESKRIGKSKK
jgi:hypothetical protein